MVHQFFLLCYWVIAAVHLLKEDTEVTHVHVVHIKVFNIGCSGQLYVRGMPLT